jgi:hypothetical protein
MDPTLEPTPEYSILHLSIGSNIGSYTGVWYPTPQHWILHRSIVSYSSVLDPTIQQSMWSYPGIWPLQRGILSSTGALDSTRNTEPLTGVCYSTPLSEVFDSTPEYWILHRGILSHSKYVESAVSYTRILDTIPAYTIYTGILNTAAVLVLVLVSPLQNFLKHIYL